MSTLTQIRTKIRRLTGRPSDQQITNDQIDDYINTFYLYDMPATLRLVTQETKFEFMTTANVDKYDMRTLTVWTGQSNEPAVDVYITVNPPAYAAGYQMFWTQSREQYLNNYPELAQISQSVVGDGTAGPYAVTFSTTPVLQNLVTVGAIDDTGATVNAIDAPTNRTTGTWSVINTNSTITGSISYVSGSVTVTFDNNIPTGNIVTFTAVPYVANRPQAILFYDNTFTLRPVPDSNYLIQVNAYKRPTLLVDDVDYPELKQWWQYLAYGAAKKVFEDSQDNDSVQGLLPGLQEQEVLVLRRTIVQRSTQRTATIYTEMNSFPFGNFQNRL